MSWKIEVVHETNLGVGGGIYVQVIDRTSGLIARTDRLLYERVYPLSWWERLIGLTPEKKAIRVIERFQQIVERHNRMKQLSQQVHEALRDHLYALSQFREKV